MGRSLVGIHIRRGDVTDAAHQLLGWMGAEDSFPRKAIAALQASVPNASVPNASVLLVLGDDSAWAARHIPNRSDVTLLPTSTQPGVDLCILSRFVPSPSPPSPVEASSLRLRERGSRG